MRYRNPILCGSYPNPSICRADHNYYLVGRYASWEKRVI